MLKLILFLVFFVVVALAQEPVCPNNEEYHYKERCDNPLCGNDYCDVLMMSDEDRERYYEDCKRRQVCLEGCFCVKGYYRNCNGTCIPDKQCWDDCKLDCGENEIYYHKEKCDNPPCGNDKCDIWWMSEEERKRYIANCQKQGVCLSGCFCAPGYYRNCKGECVPDKECEKCRKCPVNEQYYNKENCDAPACGNDKCELINFTPDERERMTAECKEKGICPEGCFCSPGYLRDCTGVCVREEECKKNCVECGENEEWYDGTNCDGPTCIGDFCVVDQMIKPDCRPPCKSACYCRKGYKRDCKGRCIPEKECPKDCGVSCPRKYEVYYDGQNCVGPTCGGDKCFSAGTVICGVPCESGCYCDRGFKRNCTGDCIPEKECPRKCEEPCPPNEIWYFGEKCEGPPCGNDYCVATIDPSCPPNCESRCFCAPGYKRDCRGNCVPEKECPRDCGIKCTGVNEIWYDGELCNGPPCGRDDCMFDPTTARCLPNCDSKCYCAPGYKRDCTGVCVPEEKCPKSCKECPINEQWYDGSRCEPPTCGGDSCIVQDSTIIGCIGPCKSGCFCSPGFRRNCTGTCVPAQTCPATCGVVCPPNEVYHSGLDCNAPTCGIDDCGFDPQAYPCPPNCAEGCFCAPGYRRNKDGICVPAEECPVSCNPQCPPNEEWHDGCKCDGPQCGRDDCDFDGSLMLCSETCQSRCFCKKGYKRDCNGQCIPEQQCACAMEKCRDLYQ